jgi:hypothetical protein
MFKVPEKYRLTTGELASDKSFGNNGAFIIPMMHNLYAYCIASDGEGWQHVSIHLSTRTYDLKRSPTWEEMCRIKELFWSDDDYAIQFHPKKSDYINNHKYCLHLWRPVNIEIQKPHYSLIGIK